MNKEQLEQLRLWHKTFKEDGELFEIRILGEKTYSGYFTDIEPAIKELQGNSLYDTQNIYYTINPIKEACKNRLQYNKIIYVRGSDSTSKNDIDRRRWIAIDVDCERPSGVSSTDEEKKYAHVKAASVYKFLLSEGMTGVFVCDSSSGYHLLIRIDAKNDKESEDTIKSFLDVLSKMFTDDKVKIDKVLFDANRILRLSGSYGRKGIDTPERPHRMCKFLKSPENMKISSLSDIKAIINKYEVKYDRGDKQKYGNNNRDEQFSLRDFINKHGIRISKEISNADGTKFVLEECCFNSGHKSPDAALFEMPNGAIAFKCFHDSCSSYTWQDVRLKFEPDAYDKQYIPPPTSPYQQLQQPQKKEVKIKEETIELGKKWYRMQDIPKLNLTDIISMKTGFLGLDNRMVGLNLGEVSILSGSNSSGKSSWINTLILNIINIGYKAALWSGELRPDILKTWIQMVAAGKENLIESKKDIGKFYVNPMVSDKIDSWMGDKFYLYNNQYGSKWAQIFNDMKELVAAGVKLMVLDNLFSLDIDIFDGDKNNKQKELVLQICKFAKENDVHLILVCHPRKQVDFLRKDSISGSGDLGNAVDNIFIIHRVNIDFKKKGGEFFGEAMIAQYVNFGNVVEVAKNRMYGVVDHLCGMYYEVESRRFKNSDYETIRYGWQDPPVQQPLITIPPMEYHPDHTHEPETRDDMPFGAPIDESPF